MGGEVGHGRVTRPRAAARQLPLLLKLACLQVKAKVIRPFVDHMITLAKQNTLHSRRQVRGGAQRAGCAVCECKGRGGAGSTWPEHARWLCPCISHACMHVPVGVRLRRR